MLVSHEKGEYPAIWDTMDGLWAYFAKWEKSDKERHVQYHLYVESKNFKAVKKRVKL